LAALPLAWIIVSWGGTWALAAATLLVSLIGWWAAETYAGQTGIADPSEVVIDEVAGQWLTLLVVPPNPWFYLAGFALFRLFDIRKPWPVSWADRSLPGGLGIMVDDLFAGLYAALFLYGATQL
jgi:phosphatidylglycerophosphatase A